MKIVAETNGRNHPYTPQLQIQARALAPGEEWAPQSAGWSVIQISDGNGYWLQGQSRTGLETGSVVLAAGAAPGRVLASCLNGLALRFFTVMPERLPGLITQGEQDFFRRAAGRRDFHEVWEPRNPLASRMRELCAGPSPGGLLARLTLLQLWAEAFGIDGRRSEPVQTQPGPMQADVKDRLRVFLLETPPAVLLEISFAELAKVLHCTPRHLSRVFFEVAGVSFREKRAEIRLSRARELLATSQSKVVDVAYKSGFKSLSLFNRMFTQRFGVSPGRWRQKNDNGAAKELPEPKKENGKTRIKFNGRRFGRS